MTTIKASRNGDLPLRHTVATLAYRAAKVLRRAPPDFSAFRAAKGSRSTGEILAHMGDLLDWALSLARGKKRCRNSKPRSWSEDTERFFAALTAFDRYLASDAALHARAAVSGSCGGCVDARGPDRHAAAARRGACARRELLPGEDRGRAHGSGSDVAGERVRLKSFPGVLTVAHGLHIAQHCRSSGDMLPGMSR